jgi:uncharacterized protein (TIGR02466 family)
MKNKIHQLFGFPIYRASLKKEKYNRNSIIKTVLKNYDKSKTRNNWDNSILESSNIHHSLCDDNNTEYDVPDYSSLGSVYIKHTKKYIKQLNLNGNVKFSCSIVNYTCMTQSQRMRRHLHIDCDFSGVHYIKFDDKCNDSTLFENTLPHASYINKIIPGALKKFDNSNAMSSYLCRYFKYTTKEDDVIIFPALLEHSVPEIKSDKPRITIAFNIKVDKNE